MKASSFTFIISKALFFPAAGMSAQDTNGKAQVMIQQQGYHRLHHPEGMATAWKRPVEKTEEP